MEDNKKQALLEKPESSSVFNRIWQERYQPRTIITAAQLAAMKEDEEDSDEKILNENKREYPEKKDQ